MSDLINRLRATASKGVSVWGDLQVEAAKEIEILTAEREAYASAMDRMTKEVEALQALIEKQKADNLALVTALNESEAKLKELDAQEPRTYMDGYSDCKQWALEEAAKICDSTPPHPFRPSIEAAWAIRKLKEGL